MIMTNPQSATFTRPRRRLVDYRYVMRELSVGKSTAYRLMDSGELGSVYVIGRMKKIEMDGVEAYLLRCKDADIALVE